MPQFGDLEAAIMERVWAADGPVLARDILAGLPGERRPAYTMVQTVVEILHRKGWLTWVKDGRAFRYSATAPRDDWSLTEAARTRLSSASMAMVTGGQGSVAGGYGSSTSAPTQLTEPHPATTRSPSPTPTASRPAPAGEARC